MQCAPYTLIALNKSSVYISFELARFSPGHRNEIAFKMKRRGFFLCLSSRVFCSLESLLEKKETGV